MKGETLKGHLDMLVLAAVADGPRHGYGIIEHIREKSAGAFALPEGTLYPVLHRLEAAGLLEANWDDSSGRRRKVYRISTKGRRRFRERKKEWILFSQSVSLILGTP